MHIDIFTEKRKVVSRLPWLGIIVRRCFVSTIRGKYAEDLVLDPGWMCNPHLKIAPIRCCSEDQYACLVGSPNSVSKPIVVVRESGRDTYDVDFTLDCPINCLNESVNR